MYCKSSRVEEPWSVIELVSCPRRAAVNKFQVNVNFLDAARTAYKSCSVLSRIMKTPKVKKRGLSCSQFTCNRIILTITPEVSLHSRAARRGQEPPAKDLAVNASAEETEYKPWMHSAQNGGISKKKKGKTLTHAQRMRQQKALEKADAIASRLETKVDKSKKKSRTIQARAADWEELNGKLGNAKGETKDAKKTGKDVESGQAMEDVVLPDLEQPLPIRSAEEIAAENLHTKK